MHGLTVLTGQQVLLALVIACLAILLLGRWISRLPDRTTILPLLPIPGMPDPYEIAFLRGGPREVIRIAAYALVQRGYLADAGRGRIQQQRGHPDLDHLTKIERSVFGWFATPATTDDIFRMMTAPIDFYCGPYRKRLKAESLFSSSGARGLIAGTLRWVALGALGLAGMALFLTFAPRPTSIGDLIFLTVLLVVAFRIVKKSRFFSRFVLADTARLSSRGKAYLERLRAAFPPRTRDASNEDDPNQLAIITTAIFGLAVIDATGAGLYGGLFPGSVSGGWHQIASRGCGGGCGGDGGCGGCGGCAG